VLGPWAGYPTLGLRVIVSEISVDRKGIWDRWLSMTVLPFSITSGIASAVAFRSSTCWSQLWAHFPGFRS
jgi:hypothetical protein